MQVANVRGQEPGSDKNTEKGHPPLITSNDYNFCNHFTRCFICLIQFLAGSVLILNIYLLFQVCSIIFHWLLLHWSCVSAFVSVFSPFIVCRLSLSVTIQFLFTLLLLFIDCVCSLLFHDQMFKIFSTLYPFIQLVTIIYC